MLIVTACAAAEKEGWSSYYYGLDRGSGVQRRIPVRDNDDDYALPRGYWQDDQIPQDPQRY